MVFALAHTALMLLLVFWILLVCSWHRLFYYIFLCPVSYMPVIFSEHFCLRKSAFLLFQTHLINGRNWEEDLLWPAPVSYGKGRFHSAAVLRQGPNIPVYVTQVSVVHFLTYIDLRYKLLLLRSTGDPNRYGSPLCASVCPQQPLTCLYSCSVPV